MAVTGIKVVMNATSDAVSIKDHEEPAKEGRFVQVSVGDEGCGMWVPWCNSPTDFLGAYYINN